MEYSKSMLLKELLEINHENTELRKKTVQEKEIIEVNKKLPLNNPLTIKELSKIIDEFFLIRVKT